MKITVIGGGSTLWSLGFCRQFVRSEPLQGAEVVLMDIDSRALDLVGRAAEILNQKAGSPITIRKTTDLDTALDGAQFVLVSISTGGLDAMQHDLEIPERYGIWQPVGDTVGPGGWMRAVRNVPVFDHIGARMQALCPNAWLINVSNPLCVLTRVPHRRYGLRVIGMCPGVDAQARRMAQLAGCPPDAPVDFVNTGIDHGSWFTSLTCGGVDVLARLKELGYCRSDDALPSEVITEDPLAKASGNRAVFAMWRTLGYLPSISDRHAVENWPWIVARESGDLPFGVRRTSIAERREAKTRSWERHERFVATQDESILGSLGHGDDPIVAVIESLLGHRSFLCTANLPNIGQIPGFPEGAVVETRCRFDGSGAHPFVSPMPDLLKALVLPIVLRQEAIIDIALNGTFDDLVALVYTDPQCCRLLPHQCRAMVREMLEANRALIRNPRLLEFEP